MSASQDTRAASVPSPHGQSLDGDGDGGGDGGGVVRAFWPEVGVALLLLALAVLVVADSLRVGIGWADDGPRSGYFPFYIGLLLGGAAAWILAGTLRGRAGRGGLADAGEPFAERAQLRLVAAMLVPLVLYVAAIAAVGIYVASAALIAWFMLRHGRYRLPATAAIAFGVPLVAFLVFERWFLVPLPKGPIERMLGF